MSYEFNHGLEVTEVYTEEFDVNIVVAVIIVCHHAAYT